MVLSAGVAMSVRTQAIFQEGEIRFQRKIKEYVELQGLEARVDGYERVVASFNDLESVELSSLKDLLRQKFQVMNPDDIRETRREALDGWLVRDVEAALNDVVLSKVMELAVDVEKMRPPWVLQKCVLTASSSVEGRGNAVLTFTGVSK